MTRKRYALFLMCAAFGHSASADPGPLDLSTGSSGFFNSPIIGAFTDVFTFTIATPSTVSASVTSVVNGNQDVDFTSLSISGPGGIFAFTQLLSDPVEVWSLPGALLGAGAYTFTLIGVNSAGGGSYGGNLAATPAAPVPEPETYLLMLAGLASLGFVARRRRVSNQR